MNFPIIPKLKEYAVKGLIALTLISPLGLLHDHARKTTQLNNSDYIARYLESTGSLYGFDDDQNGLVDRIEEIGIIPSFRGIPVFRIERTHLPTDNNYAFYAARLKQLGTTRS